MEELIKEFFEQRKQAIIRLQQEKGIKATGKSAAKLTVVATDNRYQLIDKAGYFEQQETGTPPPGTSKFQDIYEWLSLKKYGINWKSEEDRRRIAERIVDNHQRLGSYLWRRKRLSGVLSEALNDQGLDILLTKLADRKVTEVKTDILGIFK